ncbi:MAG TPA: aldo/keto reductase [Candidatus Saccharimonadales bacterium]|nr:aldo/keto reductase [Candidatus Saccharimonadales bacterium]
MGTIVPSKRLANGAEIPLLGFGTWRIPPGLETERAVTDALEAGYRLIDTAQEYGNEESVGRAIGRGRIPRDEIFVTTKYLGASPSGLRRSFDESCRRLGGYVDLFLLHWPIAVAVVPLLWREMEKVAASGRCRAIGISNAKLRHLAAIRLHGIQPAVNQLKVSAFTYNRQLSGYCQRRGMAVQAYCPLAHGRKLYDPRLLRMSEEIGKTPAQILIRWALQQDFIVLPKSVHRDRIRQNLEVFDFQLTPAQLQEMDGWKSALWSPFPPGSLSSFSSKVLTGRDGIVTPAYGETPGPRR